jgi:hypothetical protein
MEIKLGKKMDLKKIILVSEVLLLRLYLDHRTCYSKIHASPQIACLNRAYQSTNSSIEAVVHQIFGIW